MEICTLIISHNFSSSNYNVRIACLLQDIQILAYLTLKALLALRKKRTLPWNIGWLVYLYISAQFKEIPQILQVLIYEFSDSYFFWIGICYIDDNYLHNSKVKSINYDIVWLDLIYSCNWILWFTSFSC